MPELNLSFKLTDPKDQRISSLNKLRNWIKKGRLNASKKEILNVLIKYADQKFVQNNSNNATRMLFCENIFNSANYEDFLGHVRWHLEGIKKYNSKLRINLLTILEKYKSIGDIIYDFKETTNSLQSYDQHCATMAIVSLLVVALSLRDASENPGKAIPVMLAIVAMNYLIFSFRKNMSSSQQTKLEYLFSTYKSLTANGPADTHKPDVIKILKAIAPYINTEDLIPWATKDVTGVSPEFIAIVEQPPHGVIIVNPESHMPKLLSLGTVTITRALGTAANVHVEVKDDQLRMFNQREKRFHEKHGIVRLLGIEWKRSLYGRAKTRTEVADNTNTNTRAETRTDVANNNINSVVRRR